MQIKSLRVCCRRFLKTFLLNSMIFAFYHPAVAQRPGYYGAPSLLFSPSAVANGMGSGLVAASTEASAIYYNPAALTRLGKLALEGNTFKLFTAFKEDAQYHHLAGTFRPSSKSYWWLGAAYMRTGYGKLPYTRESSPEVLGEYEPYERAFTLAAATYWGENTSFGAAVKFVEVNFGPFRSGTQTGDITASAFAVDLGFLYDGFLSSAHLTKQFLPQALPWQKWMPQGLAPGFSFGMTLSNVGTKLEYINAAPGDPLPQNLRIGLAWNIFDSDLVGLAATGEITKFLIAYGKGSSDPALKTLFTSWTDESLRDEFDHVTYSGGVEVGLLKLAAIRWGRRWNGETEFGYNTFGYSLGPPGLRFSFAQYTPFQSITIDEWHIYTASIVLERWPW